MPGGSCLEKSLCYSGSEVKPRSQTWWWRSTKGIKPSSWWWWRWSKCIKQISLLLWLRSRLLLLLGSGPKCSKTWLRLLSRLGSWWSKWIKRILSRCCCWCAKRILCRCGRWCTKCIERSKATCLWWWSKLTWKKNNYQHWCKHIFRIHKYLISLELKNFDVSSNQNFLRILSACNNWSLSNITVSHWAIPQYHTEQYHSKTCNWNLQIFWSRLIITTPSCITVLKDSMRKKIGFEFVFNPSTD